MDLRLRLLQLDRLRPSCHSSPILNWKPVTAKEEGLFCNPFSALMGTISVSSDSSFMGNISNEGVCGADGRDSLPDSVVAVMSS